MDDGDALPESFREIDLGDVTLPLWVLPFDAAGGCSGLRTRERIVADIAADDYTDVFLFSHGWNNTFERATDAYARFMVGYHELVRSHALPHKRDYRPLCIGFHWPSIDLILPGERAPKIAADLAPDGPGAEPMDPEAMLREAQASVGPATAGMLGPLAARRDLSETEAREFSTLLAGAYPDDPELDEFGGRPDPREVLATWSALVEAGFTEAGDEPAGPESFGVAIEDRPAADPEAAALLPRIHLDPRDILRAFTVHKMKDRAGRVGATGVGPFLSDCLTADAAARIHLIGHSYGGRVCLSAICGSPPPRSVSSLLLLEPAVNYLCFARQVPKIGRPGGFRSALSYVEQPILSTFSANDKALHDFFHIAVRRKSDLGELKIAALGEVPSLYAALGGWGPGGLDPDEATEVPLARFPDRYPLDGVSYRVYALNGTTGINGHSDVINEWTYWALYNQVTA